MESKGEELLVLLFILIIIYTIGSFNLIFREIFL